MSYVPIGSELLLRNGNAPRAKRNAFSRLRRAPTGRRRSVLPSQRDESSGVPIIVHCHLAWDWVWQRPQQFISRLSRRHRILFVETVGPDPQLSSPLARFHTPDDFPNVTVLRIQFPAWRWSDGARVDCERRRLVKEFLRGPGRGQFDKPVQWFYDPMTVTSFAGQMNEVLTVYDCMDELSKFREAPADMHSREKELLSRADLVFTGGRKLFESKSRFHHNCHFYGCGVDLPHFSRARNPDTIVPDEIASLPKPVLGYFGVVDERIDYDLLRRLGEAEPGWSVVLVGPALKGGADLLPRRPNIHWLGKRPYHALPTYCKGFDVCLMPFAMNEATEFINPTKSLEYMAAGRPVVSSAISDVIRNFGSVVSIAHTHEEFVALCRKLTRNPAADAIELGLQLAAENSWDHIVSQLEQHMAAALARKQEVRKIL